MNIKACQQTMNQGAMGIHLALLTHKNDSPLCQMIEEALRTRDWSATQIVQSCFAALDFHEQALILTGVGHPQEIADAVSHLEIKVYVQEAWKEIVQARKDAGAVFWN